VSAFQVSHVPADLPGLDPAWSQHVTVDDADGVPRSWHFLDNGVPDPAAVLLCVHGNPTWSYLWRRLLASAPPGWRVVAPDQLGMGWSERLTSPRTLPQRVADLGDLTSALGITGPVVTVGHDWGGVISLGWALAHRDQLRGVVLTNTAIAQPANDRGPAILRLAKARLLRQAVTVRTPAFVYAATLLSRPALPAPVRRAFAAPYDSAERRQSLGDFVADIPFAIDHPSRPALDAIEAGVRSIDVPVLLLWGPRDPVFADRYLAELRKRLPQAQLHRYEGASHLLPEDAPQYAEAVTRWVADLDRGTGVTVKVQEAADVTEAAAAEAGRPRLWSALAERSGDAAPAVVEVGGSTTSWSQLARRVDELAAGLAIAGVRPGHRVALLVPPSADLTAAVYAVWRAGAVIVVADKGLGFAGMRRALRSAAVDHVVGSGPGLVAARLMRLPGSRIAAGGKRGNGTRALGAEHDLTELATLGRTTPSAVPVDVAVDDDCAVVFTSGATGPAKGVVYTHRQVLAQLELVRSTYRLTQDDRLVAAFAPFALLGPALGIGSAVPDIDVTAPGTLTAAALADAAAAVDATVVFASPAALRCVAATATELSTRQRAALGKIRLLMSAGAPVPASLLHTLREVLPTAEAHTPYGMTEVLPVTDISTAEIDAAGSGEGVCVGRPLPGVEVRVSPLSASGIADGPLIARPDRTGEICVRAGHIKDRYDALWATEQAASRDVSWHRTGDVGHLDPQGRLWIEGRLPHVISTAHGVVTPVGVEQRMEGLDDVAAAAAVGVGPTGTQVVVAVVVPADSAPARRGRRTRWLSTVPGKRAGLTPAEPVMTDAVRRVAGVDVAAVLVAERLPVDIRHASKVDRQRVARDAVRVLAGSRSARRSRRPATS
jgi:olefin beta-lactone synthetase